MFLTPPQEDAVQRVARLHRELSEAEDELTRLIDPEPVEHEPRPPLRLVHGGGLAVR
ncbi:MAG TPA: hypothetical protein VN817_06890 [Solirubrobacteraceae bacterium]|nr:hypothetical protein [Solirubrobacteraceae bacterium]